MKKIKLVNKSNFPCFKDEMMMLRKDERNKKELK